MRELARLLSYLGPRYRRDAVLGILIVVVETALEMFIPLLMARIIDDGIADRDAALIWRQGALMIGCAVLALVLGLGYARFASSTSIGLGANLRRAAYAHIQELSFANLDRYQISSLVTRMTTDITVIQNALANGFRPMVRGPVMLVMGLVYATALNRGLALVFAGILPVLALVLGWITWRVAPLYRELQAGMDDLNRVLQEDLTAIRAVKAYVREDHERARFGRVNGGLVRTATRTFGTAVMNVPAFQASMYVAATLILWIGGRKILAGQMQVGELTGFMSYVLQIMNSLMMISSVFLLLTRALTSVERVGEVLDEVPAQKLPAPAAALTEVPDGSVAFRDVSFRYKADAEEDVLSHITLEIGAGETVGVLGGTGSGKSTLVQLIDRLYDASAGTVLVGGRDVRAYDPAALRAAVGLVLQKNVLFTGTVRDNLRWSAPDATDAEILEACRLACADEFLDRIGGLDADLGQDGAGVSGGQRQRLCIARTLLARPKILIFDDSTSACDMSTDARIRENVAELSRGGSALYGAGPAPTVIIIAQRVASVAGADRIVVMEDGRVHGVGTPAELLEHDEIYRQIHQSQNLAASDTAPRPSLVARAPAARVAPSSGRSAAPEAAKGGDGSDADPRASAQQAGSTAFPGAADRPEARRHRPLGHADEAESRGAVPGEAVAGKEEPHA